MPGIENRVHNINTTDSYYMLNVQIGTTVVVSLNLCYSTEPVFLERRWFDMYCVSFWHHISILT